MDTGRLFLDTCIGTLRDSYLPRLHRCCNRLTEEQIWWRPNPETNAIGNLILHLSGNLRQWAIHGLGSREDVRDRKSEFAARESTTKALLLEQLDTTVSEACEVFAHFDPARLTDRRTIQGYDTTGLEAAFHTTEHFGHHLGQIILMTKLMLEADLGFYSHLNATGRKEREDGGRM